MVRFEPTSDALAALLSAAEVAPTLGDAAPVATSRALGVGMPNRGSGRGDGRRGASSPATLADASSARASNRVGATGGASAATALVALPPESPIARSPLAPVGTMSRTERMVMIAQRLVQLSCPTTSWISAGENERLSSTQNGARLFELASRLVSGDLDEASADESSFMSALSKTGVFKGRRTSGFSRKMYALAVGGTGGAVIEVNFRASRNSHAPVPTLAAGAEAGDDGDDGEEDGVDEAGARQPRKRARVEFVGRKPWVGVELIAVNQLKPAPLAELELELRGMAENGYLCVPALAALEQLRAASEAFVPCSAEGVPSSSAAGSPHAEDSEEVRADAGWRVSKSMQGSFERAVASRARDGSARRSELLIGHGELAALMLEGRKPPPIDPKSDLGKHLRLIARDGHAHRILRDAANEHRPFPLFDLPQQLVGLADESSTAPTTPHTPRTPPTHVGFNLENMEPSKLVELIAAAAHELSRRVV